MLEGSLDHPNNRIRLVSNVLLISNFESKVMPKSHSFQTSSWIKVEVEVEVDQSQCRLIVQITVTVVDDFALLGIEHKTPAI